MQNKSNPKEKELKNTLSEMADKTMKNYEHALHTGIKLQEEAVKCWSSLMKQTPATQDLQKSFTNFTRVATGALPVAQKRMEEVLELMEKNTRTGTELMRKAVEAAQSPTIGDGHNKWTDLWTSSAGAIRSNAEALAQINARAIDSWVDFVRKSSELAETRVPKTA